jgi:hypothetical protein
LSAEFEDYETLLRNVDSEPNFTDFEQKRSFVATRKSVLKIHELNLFRRSLDASRNDGEKMEERLRVLTQQHSDIIERFSFNEDVLRRRLELWNSFKNDQVPIL